MSELAHFGSHLGAVNDMRSQKFIPKHNFFLLYRVRQAAHKIVNFQHFDNGILVCILISSICLACEDVVNEEAQVNTVRIP